MYDTRTPRLSRRALLAGSLASLAPILAAGRKRPQKMTPPWVNLGHGLEIRDYRLFPTEDVMRFIVEIHNTTDTAVDTPTVGLVLPHLDGENFGWANPVSPVLHPHTSDCLVGVAPAALVTNNDWGSPDWLLCDELNTDSTETLQGWDVEIRSELTIRGEQDAVSKLIITNRSDALTTPASVQGLVWDQDGRLCGASSNVQVPAVAPGESWETWAHVWSYYKYVASPFAIIDDVNDIDVTFTIQPRPVSISEGCPDVLPW